MRVLLKDRDDQVVQMIDRHPVSIRRHATSS
jgi:hypothetical protein